MTDDPDEESYLDEDGDFHESADMDELEGWLDNYDDPDLVLIDEFWHVADDEAIEGLPIDPPPPAEDLAHLRARVARYQAAREASERFRAES